VGEQEGEGVKGKKRRVLAGVDGGGGRGIERGGRVEGIRGGSRERGVRVVSGS